MAMNLSRLKILALSMPGFGAKRPTAAVVIRRTSVDILQLQGKRVGTYVNVPIEGDGPEPLARAIR
jgi:hypothetical protein